MSEHSSRGPEWEATRTATLDRDGWQCQYCQKPLYGDDATVDHIVAKARGGTDDPDNLISCCRSCNSSKGDRDNLPRINYYNPRWFPQHANGA